MKDEFDYKFELLQQEINNLQSSIRSYDSILFTIKGWAITIFSAFIFFAVKEDKPIYLGFCALAIILFWTLDAINKSFQRSFIIRHNKIEHFLRTGFSQALKERSFKKFNIPDMGARVSVKDSKKKVSPFRAAFLLHNAILYVAMLIMLGGISAVLVFV